MKKSSHLITKFSLTYMMIWPLTPFMRIGVCWRILYLLCIFILLRQLFRSRYVSKVTSLSLAFMVCLWVIILQLSPDYYASTIANSVFCLSSIIFPFIFKDQFRSYFFSILSYILIFLAFWNFISFGIYLVSPSFSRMMTSGNITNLHEASAYLPNPKFLYCCLDFSQIYAQVLIFPIISFLVWTKKIKLFSSLIYLSSVILMISQAGFTTAIILLITGGVGILFLNIHKQSSYLTLFSFTLFMGYLIKGSIGEFVLPYVENPIYKKKFEFLLAKDDMSETHFSRGELWEKSINTWLENPVFGGTNIGGHSGILDFFALYGVLMGILYLYVIIFPLKQSYNIADSHICKNFTILFGILFISNIVVNPMQIAYGVVIFGLFPLTITKFQHK